MYSEHDRSSPAASLKSLPELESIAINKDLGSTAKEKLDCIALRMRNKTNFR
jgi:hypothetical protein